MGTFQDISNQKFNKLTAISYSGKGYWLFKCDCGNKKVMQSGCVKRLKTKSCGCHKVNRMSNLNRTHGYKNTKIYAAWDGIKARCLNKKDPSYHRYGGRGISVCKRWLRFTNFLEDMGEPPTKEHSIDRINVNGNYEPSNCKWSTPREQANNRSNNIIFIINNQSQTLSDWCLFYNKPYRRTYKRIFDLGWGIEQALELGSK